MDRKELKIFIIFFFLLILICMYMSMDAYASSPTPEPTPSTSPTSEPEDEQDYTTVLEDIRDNQYYLLYALAAIIGIMLIFLFSDGIDRR